MPREVSAHEYAVYEADFSKFDSNRNGFLEPEDLVRLLSHQLQRPPTPGELAAYLQANDTNMDGKISLKEYISSICGPGPLKEGAEHEFIGKEGAFPGSAAVKPRVNAFLSKLDVDGDGFLTFDELKVLLPECEAAGVADLPKAELCDMLMNFFGEPGSWTEAGPKLMVIEKHMELL